MKIKAMVQVGKLGKLTEVTVKPQKTAVEVLPTAYGLSKVTVEAIKTQDKTVAPTTEKQTITNDSEYDALGTVTVDAIKLQEKIAEASTTEQVITADNEYNALKKVTISPIKLQNKSTKASTEEQHITADDGYTALGSVAIDALKLQDKTVKPSNSDVTVNKDAEYDALKSVTVSAVKLQDKNVELKDTEQVITADEDYAGLNKVTVPAVSASTKDFMGFCLTDSVNVYADNATYSEFRFPIGKNYTNRKILDLQNFTSVSTFAFKYEPLSLVVKFRASLQQIATDPATTYETPAKLEEYYYAGSSDITLYYANNTYTSSFNHFKNFKTLVLASKTLVKCTEIAGLLNSESAHFASGGDGAIYVPDNLVSAYKTATNWSTMSDFIKPLSEYKGWTLEDD